MSKELLKQIGENWYGEQWQAPLAREIDVSERSMRRWVAGTDSIPQGVWRDIHYRLENRGAEANYYLGEVKSTLGQVEVFGFEAWDHANGTMRESTGKSTRDRIARIGGNILPATAEWVAAEDVDAEGRLKPRKAVQDASAAGAVTGVGASMAAAVGGASGFAAASAVGASVAAAVGSTTASGSPPPQPPQPIPVAGVIDTSASDVAVQSAARQRRKIIAEIGTGETGPIGPLEMRPEPGKFTFSPTAAEAALHSSPPQVHLAADPAVLHQEMLSRIAVLEEAIATLATQPGGIGHNNPPEPIEGVSFGDDDREAIAGALAVLKAQPVTAAASTEINNAVTVLRTIGDRLWTGMVRAGAYSAKQLDTFLSEAAKSAGGEVGKRLVQAPFWFVLIGSLIAVSDVAGRWVSTLPH